ncbi:MAG TPA: sialic acid TRAP transporter substrate-binding protein SiaP [Burkholderiales bacterium]|nr:sialic acid TRAP transporter substrate-binding protein SiaP [Burkholderiales bacterium]
MSTKLGLRTLLCCATALMASVALAQSKVTLRFADVTTADAPRSQALVQVFAKEIGPGYDFQPFFGGTLYKQGTELVAVQRGNLEMANLPPSDFANQLPEFDILGAAYVVRDAAHLDRIFRSDVGEAFRKAARDKLGVVILAPAYYGVRHVNLRGKKKIQTPADLSGVKLRMPGGEGWQFLGKSIGANPVPIAYAETYTSLQTGVVDGQDNPLVNTRLMKFHEVTNQIVLTGHNIGFGLLIVRAQVFDALAPAEQQAMRAAAEKSFAWSTAEYLKQEQELVAFFRSAGLEVYTPDVQAFRAYAQKQYLQSPLSKSWPPGMLDRINAL